MTSVRRLAPVDSETRTLMLDAAEAVLREEGYAMLTSRRIANRVGVKQQLVFYYFRTMDDLVVDAFRRLAKRELERIEQLLQSERPLHEIWDVCINTADARLIAEFTALANRNEDLRKEVVDYVEGMRRIHVEALTRASKDKSGGLAGLPPVAISFLATSAALALTRESAIGISMGHAEVQALIEQSVAALEPEGKGGSPKR
jgi:AcrR family transcriptional regulator